MGKNNRKFKKRKFIVLMALVLGCISVGYALLGSSFLIDGFADISEARWNVYIDDDVKFNSNNVTAINPASVSQGSDITFEVNLKKPGDKYEFSVDFVNEGTLDAKISVIDTKSPNLSDDQKKYLNYSIKYINTKDVSVNDLLKAVERRTVVVMVEFIHDIKASDLPSGGLTTEADLVFDISILFVQDDKNSNYVNKSNLNCVSGNFETVGSEVLIGNERFYIVDVDDNGEEDDNLYLLAKYNLLAGNYFYTKKGLVPIQEDIRQSPNAIAFFDDHSDDNPIVGVTAFTSSPYWDSEGLLTSYGDHYPAYVYDNNSIVHQYVADYVEYLKSLGAPESIVGKLLPRSIAMKLGCASNNCSSAPDWLKNTAYWLGDANNATAVWIIRNDYFFSYNSTVGSMYGIRPMIVVKKTDI